MFRFLLLWKLIKPLGRFNKEVSMSEWTFVIDGYPKDIDCWALWDDGEIEITKCLSRPRGGHYFQRRCGTDEGCMGWEGNVGAVVAWHSLIKPEPPKQ